MAQTLFDSMLDQARGHFSLAMAAESDDPTPLSEREQGLVSSAMTAGILGAMSALGVEDRPQTGQ